jgi:hypothetical protein
MRQLMKACVLASTDVPSIVRADLHQPLSSVGVTASLAAHNSHRAGVCRERSLEPDHLLDGIDVGGTMPMMYSSIIFYEHCAGQLTDRQPRRPLRVVRCVLQFGRHCSLPIDLNLSVVA